MQLQGQHVLILGLGASGLAMARWCAQAGADVTVADTRDTPPQLTALQAEGPGVTFVGGPFVARLVEGTSVRAVCRSPGLAPEMVAPVVDAAHAMGLWQGGELSLFAAGLQELKTHFGYAPQVLAITGTNGKTTVTSLTGQLVARAGKTVKVAGNIGPTLLDTLTEAKAQAQLQVEQEAAERAAAELENQNLVSEPPSVTTSQETVAPAQSQDEPASETADTDETLDSLEADAELTLPVPPALQHPMARALPQVWVLELSSFQLDSSEGFEPTAATVLNISQDHLDWHGSMAAYAAAKARIFGDQALMVLNREDPKVMAMRPEPVRVKLQKPVERVCVQFGGDMPQRPGDFGIEVTHGMTWLVRAMEADETRRRRKDAEEELHIQRLMPADALRIRGRHNAVNALAALALASSAGCALGPMLYGLREYRGEPHRVEPVAIVHEGAFFDDSKGTNGGATVTREALQGTDVAMHDATDMHDAVEQAAAMARSGDAVLMSPACASFDMFDNYGHRAEVFCQAVARVAEAAGVAMEGGQ